MEITVVLYDIEWDHEDRKGESPARSLAVVLSDVDEDTTMGEIRELAQEQAEDDTGWLISSVDRFSVTW